MADIKSLADQIREELKNPGAKRTAVKRSSPVKSARQKKIESDFLAAIIAYDTAMNKSVVHVRFDENTLRLMNQFKMATGVDISKLVAYAVKELINGQPDIKIIIKQFIQNTEL